MYRCNRVVCDRRHAGVHHVQHGDALYVQGEKGRSQKVAGAGAGSFEHVHVQGRRRGNGIYHLSEPRLQVSYINTSKGNVPQYSVVLNYDTDYGSVPFAVAVEKNGTPQTQYTYNITRYQVTSDKGTKRILFVYDGDIDYDLNDPAQVKDHILPLEWVKNNYKN